MVRLSPGAPVATRDWRLRWSCAKASADRAMICAAGLHVTGGGPGTLPVCRAVAAARKSWAREGSCTVLLPGRVRWVFAVPCRESRWHATQHVPHSSVPYPVQPTAMLRLARRSVPAADMLAYGRQARGCLWHRVLITVWCVRPSGWQWASGGSRLDLFSS